jgi:hypothetical protein
VRGVQFAHHEIEEPAKLVTRLCRRHARRVAGAHGIPVDAVELLVVKAVAHVHPRLAEDLHLLFGEDHVHFGVHGDGPRLPAFDRDDRDASLLDVKHLASVGRELRVRLGTRRRRELSRNRGLACEFVH